MDKKRLLIFHPTIAPYRVDFFNALYHAFETRICLQYKNLRNQKFDYTKISSRFEFEPIYLQKNSTISLCKWVWNQIKIYQPDTVLTCEYGLVTLFALLVKWFTRNNFKLVVMTDDSYDMLVGGNEISIRHRIARRFITSHADDFVVVEPRVEQWYQKKYGKGVCFPIIVAEATATTNYERIMPISCRLAERYNLVGKRVLLSVSRLVKLKNLHRVIDAFAIAKTDAVFVIVGDGPQREALENYAKQFDKRIIFTGRFEGDELYAWYNLANVFILGSYLEPFGAVTNEALLAGCRVVVSKKAGSSCLVSDVNGNLIDPMVVEEIASAIDRQMQLSSVSDLTNTKKSLMIVSFDERIDNLVKRIQ